MPCVPVAAAWGAVCRIALGKAGGVKPPLQQGGEFADLGRCVPGVREGTACFAKLKAL